MASKYKSVFTVTLTVKTEDEKDSPASITRLLKEKAQMVSEAKIEVTQVTKTEGKAASATPAAVPTAAPASEAKTEAQTTTEPPPAAQEQAAESVPA